MKNGHLTATRLFREEGSHQFLSAAVALLFAWALAKLQDNIPHSTRREEHLSNSIAIMVS